MPSGITVLLDRGDIPAFTPPQPVKGGTRFSDLRGMQGRVEQGNNTVYVYATYSADVDVDYSSSSSAVVSCPLHDAFHFSYINNSGGPCVYPASYVKPCASASRLRFYFKECPSAAYTHDRGNSTAIEERRGTVMSASVVCLSVCLRAYLRNRTHKFHQIISVCY